MNGGIPTDKSTGFSMKNPHVILSLSLLSAVFALIILYVTFQTQIIAQLNRWSVLPQADQLTELYFTDINKLPQTYTPGKTQAVVFTVHNMERHATDYTYELLEQDTNGTLEKTLTSGTLHLEPDQRKNTTTFVDPVDIPYHTHIKVLIKLIHTPLSIEYLAVKA